jgi:hypothetical protein
MNYTYYILHLIDQYRNLYIPLHSCNQKQFERLSREQTFMQILLDFTISSQRIIGIINIKQQNLRVVWRAQLGQIIEQVTLHKA